MLSLLKQDMAGLKSPRLCQRDLDADGRADIALACDGGLRLFSGQADPGAPGAEWTDHLGDVRKMFQPVRGCGGVICEDFNNDGLIDILAWSKSEKLSLVMNRGYHNFREGNEVFDLVAALKDVGEVTAAATADIDGDGDLDVIVASGKSLYLLSNTFENKPDEANDRPRNKLLTVRGPGQFGALVTLMDDAGKPLASQRIGAGPVADTVYFGYRSPVPAAVVLTTADGKTLRQKVASDQLGKPVVFK